MRPVKTIVPMLIVAVMWCVVPGCGESDETPARGTPIGGGVLREYVDRERVADLTSFIRADNLAARLNPAALKFATFDGKTYAVPMDVSVVLMWYNRDLFAEHGVDVPKTFEDLKSVCVKLRTAGVTPIALGNQGKWPGAFYFVYLSARIGGTAPFVDAAARQRGGTFEHPSFIQAGHRLQELVRVGRSVSPQGARRGAQGHDAGDHFRSDDARAGGGQNAGSVG